MDKRHFDQLVKGVREMKRHMAGRSVRGARTMELAEPDIRAIREAAKISPVSVCQADWRQRAHVAELGAASNAANRSGTRPVEDRGV
jgi:hypothetical protein